MSKIIYQSQEMCQDYLIDQGTQQLLAYLYLFGSTHPREVANRLDYENEDAVVESVNDVLCEDKAGLAVIGDTDQATLDGCLVSEISSDDYVAKISLTENGKTFVDKYKSDIPAPFSVQDYIQEMEKIEGRIEECVRGLAERLELVNEDEYSQENLNETMDMIEDYFDKVRSNRF